MGEDYLKSPKPSTSKANMKNPFKKPFDKNNDFDSDGSSFDNLSTASTSTKASKGTTPYKKSEEKNILEWIIRNGRYSETKGIAMWKILEGSNEVPGRSHQSMKERFRKHIAPNIQHYQLDEEEVA